MKNIVLIGFMGSGKSSIGQRLAHKLNRKWLDMDTEIEKQQGRSIKVIFSEDGETTFRELETSWLKEHSDLEGYIISTGGGIVTQNRNIALMHNLGHIVFLHSEFDQIVDNLKDDTSRPLLQGDDYRMKIQKLLNERIPTYLSTADIIVQTKEKSIEEIVDELISII